MPNYSKKIIYLSKEQYQELITNNSITVNGTTINYNANDIYVTPQEEPYIKPANGIPASDLASGVIPSVPVQDVKINDTSVVSQGIATIPIARRNGPSSPGSLGLIFTNPPYGLDVGDTGMIYVARANDANIKAGSHEYKPIVPYTQHSSVFFGLAKASGDSSQASSANAVGTYTDAAKSAIQNMLGITSLLSTEESSTATAAHIINSTFMMNGKLHRATAAIAIGDAVEVGTNCEVVKADEVFVKNTDYATSSTAGIIKIGYGLFMDNGLLYANGASLTDIKTGTDAYKGITSKRIHEAVFFGLSKMAGVDLASETVTVGTYPETSKTAIRSLIGAAASSDIPNVPVQDIQINSGSILSNGIANIPKGTSTNYGVFYGAGDVAVKAGTNSYVAITANYQHASVYYGLSKLAGVDLANETVTVGTYPETSKVAINNLIGSVSKANLENAGITAKTYTTKFGGEFTVTTVTSQDYLSPYARASVTGRIYKEYAYRVTFNGTEYELPQRMWFESTGSSLKVYEYLGNLNLYVSDTSGVPKGTDDVPFIIISDLNNSNSIDILTQTTGTYTIKVEQINYTKTKIPNSLIYGDEYAPIEKAELSTSSYNGFSIGVNSLKNKRGTVSIGYGNTITDEFSFAIGSRNSVSENHAIALGFGNNISNISAAALGCANNVSGDNAVGIGNNVIANCSNMIAVGKQNVAANEITANWANNTSYTVGQLVKAIYNPSSSATSPVLMWVCKENHVSASSGTFYQEHINNPTYWSLSPSNGDTMFVVGNGVSNTTGRSNALKVDVPGNGFFNGNVYVGCNADSTGGIRLPHDVQVNGTSVVSNGVANVPVAGASAFGVVKVNTVYGLYRNDNGILYLYKAAEDKVKAGTDSYQPIVPSNQHASAFYGLAKAAGSDMASSSNAVGTYTDAAKVAIRAMLGAASSNVIAVQDEQPTDTDTKIWLPETEGTGIQVPTMDDMNNALAEKVGDVQVNGTSVVSNGVANIPPAGTNRLGVIRTTQTAQAHGLTIADSGSIYTEKASDANIKAGTNNNAVIVPSNQHYSVFYGLAKAAGDSTQAASDNAIGIYTTEAKAAIRTMIGAGTSNISDVAIGYGTNSYKTILHDNIIRISTAFSTNASGELIVSNPANNTIKTAGGGWSITPQTQHIAVFYGLAKAAGDTTMSSSSNAVGTYTADAKAAIHTMLGIDPASIAAQVDIPLVETVSGTTPSITGQPNVRYVCGEVSTLSITPPASGSVDVIFESGSTATTLTVPNTVKWPAWFDDTSLEANTTYEILITDGVYGSVMTWAT